MPQIMPAIYKQNIFNGQTLNGNAPTSFGHLIPVGPGYYDWTLRVSIVVTIGTGTGAITNGILDYIRQIYVKSDNNEIIVDNLPARSLVEMANVLSGTMPRFDQIAASNGTYRIDIPFIFAPAIGKAERPHDLVVDSSRYRSMVFDVVTGPLTDLFTSPGTATVAITCDLDCTRSKYEWNSVDPSAPNYHPILGYVNYSGRTPVDANSQTYIDMERAGDINVMQAFFHTVTAGTSGRKWFGTNSDAVIDQLTIADTDETHAKDLRWGGLQEENKRRYEIETIRSGVAAVDFCNDGSHLRALNAARNGLQARWTNQSGVSSGYYVSMVTRSWRTLRESAVPKHQQAQAA